MTDYRPFWTEQSTTTTTTTTNPSKNMKTDNDYTLIIVATVMITAMFGFLLANSYYLTQKELEFVKAGLVQKVENGNVIWTKP